MNSQLLLPWVPNRPEQRLLVSLRSPPRGSSLFPCGQFKGDIHMSTSLAWMQTVNSHWWIYVNQRWKLLFKLSWSQVYHSKIVSKEHRCHIPCIFFYSLASTSCSVYTCCGSSMSLTGTSPVNLISLLSSKKIGGWVPKRVNNFTWGQRMA